MQKGQFKKDKMLNIDGEAEKTEQLNIFKKADLAQRQQCVNTWVNVTYFF